MKLQTKKINLLLDSKSVYLRAYYEALERFFSGFLFVLMIMSAVSPELWTPEPRLKNRAIFLREKVAVENVKKKHRCTLKI